MAAYVASGRVVRATPRLAAASDARRFDLRAATAPSAGHEAAVLADADGCPVEPEPTSAERWAAIRERWSQLTFYLFDANSWR